MSTLLLSTRRRVPFRSSMLAIVLAFSHPVLAAQPSSPNGGMETVAVMVDYAKVVRLPEQAQTVIVGNPSIADVSIQKNGIMVVTGKSFGVTNLIALDATGKLLAESLVRVGATADSMLTVHRGLERETYACTPNCQPSIQVGDTAKFFDGVGNQTSARNGFAAGVAPK